MGVGVFVNRAGRGIVLAEGVMPPTAVYYLCTGINEMIAHLRECAPIPIAITVEHPFNNKVGRRSCANQGMTT